MRDTIERPIRAFGGKITNRLVNRVLNDLGEEQDQLPVLQRALMRLWSIGQETSAARAPNLDLELYDSERIGGMKQALSQHVKEILRSLNTSQQRLAEILFRNLTAVADNGELVRDPTRLDAIAKLAGASTDAVAAVIECFRGEGKSFLMPPAPELLTADKTIDISHESLIRQWDELKKWTRDEHRWRQVRRELSKDAAKWNREGRQASNEPDFLLQGLRLAEATEWRKKHPEELGHPSMTLEREFLTRSEAQRDEALRKAGSPKRRTIAACIPAVEVGVGDHHRRRSDRCVPRRFCLQELGPRKRNDRGAGQKRIATEQGYIAKERERIAKEERPRRRQHGMRLIRRESSPGVTRRCSTAERLANASGQLPEQQAVSRLLLAAEAMRSTLVTESGDDTRDEIRPEIRPGAVSHVPRGIAFPHTRGHPDSRPGQPCRVGELRGP